MNTDTVILFTRFGLGDAPDDLQKILVTKFLGLLLESGQLPSKILFYTAGVQLVCSGSPVIEALQKLQSQGVELVVCKTCLDYYNLASQVQVGIVGGMGDILETLQKAPKVLSV
jgi:intracellular sulfur oxidation DsrE/DsrF family protein